MKTDSEVRMAMEARGKGKTQQQSAAKADMSVQTLRKYERTGKLPSQMKNPREYRTRVDPFAGDWPWIEKRLEADPAIQGKTLFELLCERHPGKYSQGQLRTLNRHIALWRARHGPGKEVMFEQVHKPGEMAQSDFTSMNELGVTIGGERFDHLLFHLVLTYSNIEAVRVCPSESFESLSEGMEHCLWRIGGVPLKHRTDHLSAAVKHLNKEHTEEWVSRYQGLLKHYGMAPDANNAGEAHENGDVEQSHYRFKSAVGQALILRGSRDFKDRREYDRFLEKLVRHRNQTRQARFDEERQHLKPLPAMPLMPARELRLKVTRFSTIRVLSNIYSVPSRLIGTQLIVRVRAEELEIYVGTQKLMVLPRLTGRGKARIDYKHISWSLVRKPGAFAAYRYREELFPSVVFRRAYDLLTERVAAKADREYVRVLHLAASTSETEVEAAISLLLETKEPPAFDAVRELVREPKAVRIPYITPPTLDFGVYDRLLAGGAR